jgi:hypothetical protein
MVNDEGSAKLIPTEVPIFRAETPKKSRGQKADQQDVV